MHDFCAICSVIRKAKSFKKDVNLKVKAAILRNAKYWEKSGFAFTQWKSMEIGLVTNVLQNTFFVFCRRNKIKPVWNDVTASK